MGRPGVREPAWVRGVDGIGERPSRLHPPSSTILVQFGGHVGLALSDGLRHIGNIGNLIPDRATGAVFEALVLI